VAVCFLLHLLAGHPGWVLPTALLCGARTFLGAARAATRPSAGFCPRTSVNARVTAISLGTTLPQPSSGLPGNSASSLNVPCLTLLRTRFTQRARSLGPLVVSYTTVSPLPPARARRHRPEAVCSLLHFLADCSGWVLPTVLLCGARTFLGTLPKKGDATAWLGA
jgi:hypothetical protein